MFNKTITASRNRNGDERNNTRNTTDIFTVPEYDFKHAICNIVGKTPSEIQMIYENMMVYLELDMNFKKINYMSGETEQEGETCVFQSYNMIISKNYLFIVPRALESYKGVNVNSLGFVGCFLTKGDEQFNVLATEGPLSVLKAVTLTRT